MRVFTCSKILRYLRVAWSIKSRTVHPALQGTTTTVSPKVTVTFIAAVKSNVFEKKVQKFTFPTRLSPGAAPCLTRKVAPVCRNWSNRCLRSGWNHGEGTCPPQWGWKTSEDILFPNEPSYKSEKSGTTAAECDFLSRWAVRWYSQTNKPREEPGRNHRNSGTPGNYSRADSRTSLRIIITLNYYVHI